MNAIIDKTRPTTSKNAIIANGYRVLKVDNLDNQPILNTYLIKLLKIKSTTSDIIIFSDFRHGIFNSDSVKLLTNAINKKLKSADSQVATRWVTLLILKNLI